MNEVDQAGRQDFYQRIAREAMAPLWETLHQLVTPEPQTIVQPYLWSYDRIARPALMEAGRLITAREAERRVLILQNPGLGGAAAATRSLYAGLQLILPGDVAPAHRHSQNALRFILEGRGAFTAVNGERTMMNPGDLVITPAWSWHDHGNDGDEPTIWLDILDIPIVSFLETSFAEAGDADVQPEARPIGDSDNRFGHNLVPVDWRASGSSSPLFNYPYERTRSILAGLECNAPPDAWHGYKLRYVDPSSGGHVTPTMAAFIQKLPAGFATAPYRSTDSAIVTVVEGEGATSIGEAHIAWRRGDVFVIPSWKTVVHRPRSDAVLFSASDRAIQEKVSLWREQRLALPSSET